MKEVPILYSTPMVQAKFDGRKTQTRRMTGLDVINESPDDWEFNWFDYTVGWCFNKKSTITKKSIKDNSFTQCIVKSPNGDVDDVQWVREAWYKERIYPNALESPNKDEYRIIYRADKQPRVADIMKWKPSIHLHKHNSRIWDLVTGLRVERLHSITESDAIAEGITPLAMSGMQLATEGQLYQHYTEHNDGIFGTGLQPIKSYSTLWESINGKDSWEKNPWVFVYTTMNLSLNGRPKGI